jgi:hypothetical protein
MTNWGSLWFRKMARQKQMVSKMAGNPSDIFKRISWLKNLFCGVNMGVL